MIAFFLGTKLGRHALVVLAIAFAVGGIALFAHREGDAAAAAAAAAIALERIAAANRARMGVRPDDHKEMASDPHNRDRRIR